LEVFRLIGWEGTIMEKRELNKSGLFVAPFALGCNVLGWTVDEQTAFKLLDLFVGSGCNLIDTADVYSRWVEGNKGGESEGIIGKWLKRDGNRSKVVLATKVGSPMGHGKEGLSKQYILQECERSLQRLQTDHIDLYQSHYDDQDTPLEETLEAYAELVRQGKVRVIGASNYSSERLLQAFGISRANGWPEYRSLQTLYNLYERKEYEAEHEPFCREHGLGVLTYYSLARGFLTGKYRSSEDLSKSVRGLMIARFLDERGHRILEALDKVARQYQATPAAVALGWVMARPTVTAAIASATGIEQLEMLIEATSLNLDSASLDLLNKASQENTALAA
jgi:aryl-alcohol dehydrogenase-like predicted oxidoreductase